MMRVFRNILGKIVPVLLTADALNGFLKGFMLVFKSNLVKLISHCVHRLT